MSEAPYSEPKGYRASPGFVKSNPLNNDYYVEGFRNDPWYPIIKQTHDDLTELIPSYNIAQIKEKFGGLRYYIDYPNDLPEELDDEWQRKLKRAEGIIRYAEAWVDGFEAGRV